MSLWKQIEALKREAAAAPTDASLCLRLALMLEKAGDGVGASNAYLRAAELFASHGLAFKAVAFAKQAMRANPLHPFADETLAALHLGLGLESEAVAYLLRALMHRRQARDDDGVQRITGKLLALGRSLDEINNALPAAVTPQLAQVSACPDDIPRLLALGKTLRDSFDDVGAASAFLRAAKLHARTSLPAAVALAKEAVLKLNPRLVEANELLAGWCARLHATEDAIVYWRAALRQHQASRDAEGVARVQAELAALGATNGARA